MHSLAILSMLRSGSTGFARDVAHANNWTYVGEPFNFKPRHVNTSKDFPGPFLDELARVHAPHHTPLVFKVFSGHTYRLHEVTNVCVVVLERSNMASRWCSLYHARRTHEWGGAVRRNCTMDPPWWFVDKHVRWYEHVRRTFRNRLHLTFDDIVHSRNASLSLVADHCHSRFS